MNQRILIFILILASVTTKAQEKVTIQGDQTLDTTIRFMQGFLHGGSLYVDSGLVSKLKPAFWRIGAYWIGGSGYEETKRFNPKITVNINDLYMIVHGIPSQTLSKPWADNWQNWDQLVTEVVTKSLNEHKQVDYWDLWGEPDAFWTGTVPQWIEMYRRTDSIITSIDPNAKITGPEFAFASCNFNIQPILWFLDTLYTSGAGVDGVSWHELCNNPEEVVAHVQQLRAALALRPWLGELSIHIPEYASPQNSTVPGWNLGWIHYLEKAKVDWVSHACWNETDGLHGWSNCQFGLNGLFMQDNITPQPNYWVHRAYAELNTMRLETYAAQAKTIGLASKDNATKEMKIMVGRYNNPNLGAHNASAEVELAIKHFPYCSNCTMPLVIQRIPSNDVPYSVALNAPITTFSGTLSFVGDSASVFINEFVDGDVYLLYVNPSDHSVLSTQAPSKSDFKQFQIAPNPATENIQIYLANNQSTSFQIFNAIGIAVKTFTITESAQINLSNLPNGLYFIRNVGFQAQTLKLIKQ